MSATPHDTQYQLRYLDKFVPYAEHLALSRYVQSSEEREFYRDKVAEVFNTINTMPVTYQQDGKGDDAIAYLHYFHPNGDWYITELDIEDGISQCFGYACINGDLDMAELGYISIAELTAIPSVELDLYWTPVPLRDVKRVLRQRYGRQ